MYLKKSTGKLGEDIACSYLKKHNYIIIERNFFCYQGEIDIIAKDTIKKELVFIEVKTRTNLKYGYPIDAINKNKQTHLFKSCQFYLYLHHIPNIAVRIDVIEIFIHKGKINIHHIKQIF